MIMNNKNNVLDYDFKVYVDLLVRISELQNLDDLRNNFHQINDELIIYKQNGIITENEYNNLVNRIILKFDKIMERVK
jgi:hypothetical protein